MISIEVELFGPPVDLNGDGDDQVVEGDVLVLRNGQICPADSILLAGSECSRVFVAGEVKSHDLQGRYVQSVLEMPNEVQLEDAIEQIHQKSCIMIEACPPTDDDEFSAQVFIGEEDFIEASSKHFVRAGERMQLSEWGILAVVYSGESTKRSLRAAESEEEPQLAEMKLSDSSESMICDPQPQQPAAAARIASLADESSIVWESAWTDTLDDGNCFLSCIFFTLKRYIDSYPHLVSGNARIAAISGVESPQLFREWVFDQLALDEAYTDQLRSMMNMFIEIFDDETLLQIEDFTTLPVDIRNQIMSLKSAWNRSQRAPSDLEYQQLVSNYVKCLRGHWVSRSSSSAPLTYLKSKFHKGRPTFLPLGEPEVGGTTRLLGVRLEMMKNQSICKRVGIEPVRFREIDPRTINERDIQVVNSDSPLRVRMLNVNDHHYFVHFPQLL